MRYSHRADSIVAQYVAKVRTAIISTSSAHLTEATEETTGTMTQFRDRKRSRETGTPPATAPPAQFPEAIRPELKDLQQSGLLLHAY